MNVQRRWLVLVVATMPAACLSAASPSRRHGATTTEATRTADTGTDSQTGTATGTGTASRSPTATSTATSTAGSSTGMATDIATASHTATDSSATATDRSTIEFGRKLWGSDDATRGDVPVGGTLFSVWTRIPDPGSSYPWSRGNMDVYVLSGKNWYFRCLVGNSSAQSPSNARYNANSMLFANPGETWVADYSYYESGGGHPEAPYRDWVWVAWQVLVNKDSFTIRQWLKFGMEGEVLAAGESSPSFAEARALLVKNGWSQSAAAAWTPGDATGFQVGKDNGYLSHARMMARASVPTLAELDASARRDAADSSAWADYRLAWSSGQPDLSDRSGNDRALTLASGGTLYPGPTGPAF